MKLAHWTGYTPAMNPLIVKGAIVLSAAGLATLSVTVLAGTPAEQFVMLLAGTLVGWVIPELGKKPPAEESKGDES